VKKVLILIIGKFPLLLSILTISVLGCVIFSPAEDILPASLPNSEDKEKIEMTVKAYVKAIYSRNYQKVYELTSHLDHTFKTEENYLRENASFRDLTLELAEKLAESITYKDIKIQVQENRARVTMVISLPDGNAPEVQNILLEEERPKGASRNELLEKLEALRKTGKIPTVEGEQEVELVKENNAWLVFLDWENGIRINFKGSVKKDLPWSFEPVQRVVRIQPGEALQNVYRVKNLSDKPITGKALHAIEPENHKQYLNIIDCFCFIQETLQPGEEKELPLIFQLDANIPKDLKQLEVIYEFYPSEFFEEMLKRKK
jgi:cytochrome c oxidase assembly protein Cox11